MKGIVTVLLLALVFWVTTSYGEETKIEPDICGPVKAIHGMLESAGYQFSEPFVRLHEGKALMVYLPSEQRISSQRLKGKVFLGLEKVEVVHEDASEHLPGGRRCIESIGYISPDKVDALRAYLDRVSLMIRPK